VVEDIKSLPKHRPTDVYHSLNWSEQVSRLVHIITNSIFDYFWKCQAYWIWHTFEESVLRPAVCQCVAATFEQRGKRRKHLDYTRLSSANKEIKLAIRCKRSREHTLSKTSNLLFKTRFYAVYQQSLTAHKQHVNWISTRETRCSGQVLVVLYIYISSSCSHPLSRKREFGQMLKHCWRRAPVTEGPPPHPCVQ
jgi:hypothetical protein